MGTLGNGTTVASSIPMPVNRSLMSEPVTAIDAGTGVACAISGGKAYCWGSNSNGALGNGSAASQSTTPAQVALPASDPVSTISVGTYYACALSGGQAYCWGLNSAGQLGIGSTTASTTPVAVSNGVMSGRVTSISAGSTHTCASAIGNVYCWGSGSNGQLGSSGSSNVPKIVSSVSLNERTTAVTAGNVLLGAK